MVHRNVRLPVAGPTGGGGGGGPLSAPASNTHPAEPSARHPATSPIQPHLAVPLAFALMPSSVSSRSFESPFFDPSSYRHARAFPAARDSSHAHRVARRGRGVVR